MKNNPNKQRIFDTIRDTRKRLKMTQAEFAVLLGTTRYAIADYETRQIPRADFWLKIQVLRESIEN